MSKHIINAGATSQRFYIYLQDSTTGQGETGVTGATCYYLRDSVSGSMPAAVTLTFGAVFASPGTYPAWSSGQVREIGYMPGLYLIDIPDAVFAVGARNVVVQIFPTSGTPWLPVNLEFTLAAVNIYDAVRMGMTALPNIVQGNAGALITSGTGTAQLSVASGLVTAGSISNGAITTSTFAAGAINSAAIADGAIDAATFADSALVIGSGAAGGVKAYLDAGSITAGVVATGAIDADAIASAAITSAKFAGDAITASVIANGAIDAATFAAGAINAAAIADSAITIRMSGDGTPSEGRIIAGSIANDVWNAATASYTTTGTFGKLMDILKKANFVIEGTTVAGSTTTSVNTGLTGYLTDAFKNQTILFISGALAGTSSLIIASSSGGGVFTLDGALPAAPASGVDFVVLGTHVHGTQEIANVTWATDISGYTSPTAGYAAYQGLIEAALAKGFAEQMTQSAYIESHADTLLGRNIAGGSNAGRLVKEALYALRNKSEIVGNQLNVYNNVDSAVAWTATVASSAGANPVTGVDPA